MATTANGTPYVEASDLVAAYPAVSLALAEHIDDNTGKVLSVNSVTSGSIFSTSSTSFVDVTTMSITLTPKSATSTFILAFSTFQNRSGAAIEATYQYLRDSTPVGVFSQETPGSPPDSVANLFPDSPATASAITYKVQAKTNANTLNVYTRSFIIWEISA
jgi:hypothetical protein